jgi:hypothetical protein
MQPSTAAAAAAAVCGGAEAGSKQVRTLNVAMHGLEALTALHKVTKGGCCCSTGLGCSLEGPNVPKAGPFQHGCC